MIKYEELMIYLGTFIYIHYKKYILFVFSNRYMIFTFTVSAFITSKTDTAVRVDAILTGASMEARVLVTVVDIVLTVNTTEALAALTPEAGHQVVTSPVLV